MPLLLLSKSNPLRWALIWFFHGRDLNPLSSPSGFAAQRRERVGTSCTKCRKALQIPPSPPRRSKLYIACSDFYFKNRSALMPLLLLSKSNPLRWALIWFFHGRDLNPLSSPSGFAAQRRERVGTSCTKCRKALQIPPSPPKRKSCHVSGRIFALYSSFFSFQSSFFSYCGRFFIRAMMMRLKHGRFLRTSNLVVIVV